MYSVSDTRDMGSLRVALQLLLEQYLESLVRKYGLPKDFASIRIERMNTFDAMLAHLIQKDIIEKLRI